MECATLTHLGPLVSKQTLAAAADCSERTITRWAEKHDIPLRNISWDTWHPGDGPKRYCVFEWIEQGPLDARTIHNLKNAAAYPI